MGEKDRSSEYVLVPMDELKSLIQAKTERDLIFGFVAKGIFSTDLMELVTVLRKIHGLDADAEEADGCSITSQ